MKLRYILIALCILSAYLGLKRLDNTYFWDDEAHDAIFARNYLKFGKLTAWDGRNLYSYRNGTVLDENLRTRNSPLDIMVCAASFKLFGESTWTGRFPFVIAGLISLWFFFLLVKTDFGDDEWLWLYIVGGFALSMAFILNIRVCRYYSLSLLTTILSYYGYRKYMKTRKIPYFLLIVGASVLSFYANPMICAATLLSIGLVHLVFHFKEFRIKDWQITLGMSVLFLLLTMPYAIQYKIWVRPEHNYGVKENLFLHRSILISWNIYAMNLMTCLPWPIAIGLCIFLLKNSKLPVSQTAMQWGLLAVSHVIFIALISPQPTYFDAKADTRYLIGAVPFLIGLTGIFIWFVNRWYKTWGIVVFLIVLTSNILTLNPSDREFKWLLPGMLYEVHHDYPTAARGVANYIDKHAKQDDLVACFLDYNDYPLMFYMGHKIKITGTMDKKSLLPRSALKGINAPVYIDEHFPNWLVCFGYNSETQKFIDFYGRAHLEKDTVLRHHFEFDTVLNYFWYDTSRPEIQFHTFGPKKDIDWQKDAIYIFRKID